MDDQYEKDAAALQWAATLEECASMLGMKEGEALTDVPKKLRALLAAAGNSQSQDAVDAARYRWLRNADQAIGNVIDKEFAPGRWEYRSGEELDAAIDAAIAAMGKQEGGAA
ncbi:hypothetical protein [Massilia endophytica]|uniref:hypothetical protein n=1 Tax=Massilia endophytica TaxID=2899220 RepID=UPI001E53869F|nr:hypothetical protein [Massilia endophytica]UGQ44939.1 hypothetical protein LSQ66_14145 [Massilia endophytica]